MLLHNIIGNVMAHLHSLCRSAIQGLVREGIRQVLPIAIVIEWIIASADPNKPPAPNYYIPKRAMRAWSSSDGAWQTGIDCLRKATYVARQRTLEARTQSAWAHGIAQAWKDFWKTAPRKPATKNRGSRHHYTWMQT
jgi:hypothetical protein